jgi:hypothetical protein
MAAGVDAMGRPKAGTKDDPPKERLDRETVIHLKGSPEYVDWLEAIHKKTRLPKATIFRVAVEEWAKRNNHPSPPEI